MDFKVSESIIENFITLNFREARWTGSGELHFNSPFADDGKKRLYVNPSQSNYFDQKNQKGGNFISFVAEYLDIGERQAAIELIKNYSSKNEEETEDISYKEIVEVHKDIDLPDGIKFFFEETSGRTYKIAKNYLEERKIVYDDLAYVYDPHGEFDKSYHNRIIIPFYENGRMVYFIGRSFVGSKFRYKNPAYVNGGNFVFQHDRIRDSKDIFIFEGVFDALSLYPPQYGTAMLSNRLKMEQIVKILDMAPERIVFGVENDKNPIAIKAGKKNLDWNIRTMMKYKPPSLNIKFYTLRPPEPYKDFNEYSAGEDKHFIDIDKDCKEYNPNRFDVSNFVWSR